MAVYENYVYDLGLRDGLCVCLKITESSARMIPLYGKKWNDPQTAIDDKHCFGISPNSPLDAVGKFAGVITKTSAMTYVRVDRTRLETIDIPTPGNNPKKKRQRGKVDVISDAALTPGSELAEANEMDAKHPGWIDEVKDAAAASVTATLNRRVSQTSGQSDLPPS